MEDNQTPLVQPLRPLTLLYDEYRNDAIKANIRKLETVYHFLYYRPVRGDGNCFYRALSNSLVELIIDDYELFTKFCDLIQNLSLSNYLTPPVSRSVKYLLDLIQNKFYSNMKKKETFIPVNNRDNGLEMSNSKANFMVPVNENINQLRKEVTELKEEVREIKNQLSILISYFMKSETTENERNDGQDKNKFKEEWFSMRDTENNNVSDMLVLCLREMSLYGLNQSQDISQSHINANYNREELSMKILTMGNEADHIAIQGCTSTINIRTQIFHLDKSERIPIYDFPNANGSPLIYLLFRPGHYDILYKN